MAFTQKIEDMYGQDSILLRQGGGEIGLAADQGESQGDIFLDSRG